MESVESMTQEDIDNLLTKLKGLTENNPGVIQLIREINQQLNPLGIKVTKFNLEYDIIREEDLV